MKMFDADKTRMIGLPYGEKLCQYVMPFSSNAGTSRMDGRTDLLYQYRASIKTLKFSTRNRANTRYIASLTIVKGAYCDRRCRYVVSWRLFRWVCSRIVARWCVGDTRQLLLNTNRKHTPGIQWYHFQPLG